MTAYRAWNPTNRSPALYELSKYDRAERPFVRAVAEGIKSADENGGLTLTEVKRHFEEFAAIARQLSPINRR